MHAGLVDCRCLSERELNTMADFNVKHKSSKSTILTSRPQAWLEVLLNKTFDLNLSLYQIKI